MFLQKHLNTSNRGLSLWKSHPILSLSYRMVGGTLKTFSITELIGATYLIQSGQWFANCLETDVALFVQSLCMRHHSAQKSRQIMQGRELKRKQYLWGWDVHKEWIEKAAANKWKHLYWTAFSQWLHICDWMLTVELNMKAHTGEVNQLVKGTDAPIPLSNT